MQQSRYVDRERYFLELAGTSREFYMDYIRKFKDFGPGTSILEVGCGEGGNLLPFAEAECKVTGMDLASNKIANAGRFFAARNVKGRFCCADFLKDEFTQDDEKFDIILVHDVIEHIEPPFKAGFFRRLHTYLKPDGIVFFGFPAWQMPFGGHQQICKSRVCSKLPFMHLLPTPIYRTYLKLFGEDGARIDELLSIKRSAMTPELFERLCSDAGFKVIDRKLWLISPHYKVKFHLTPRLLCSPLGRIPYLRNFFTTSCFYIIST